MELLKRSTSKMKCDESMWMLWDYGTVKDGASLGESCRYAGCAWGWLSVSPAVPLWVLSITPVSAREQKSELEITPR